MIDQNGRVFNGYAVGAKADFVKNNHPQLISRSEYDGWTQKSLSAGMRRQIDEVDGEFPGHGMSDDSGNLALARLQFGNVVLIPQTAAGLGYDDFKIVHGTDAAPPHNYVAAYLWARHGFGADALMHFGAHGSLEFTPRKQVALGSEDWSDRLVGTMPHLYIYSTSNVGEAMIAKRRSYAEIINYLTPPFMESNVRGIYKNLSDAIADYNRTAYADNVNEKAAGHAADLVKKYTVELGIHRELRLDSVMSSRYTAEEIQKIENFAEELANEKIAGALYVMGLPYSPEHIKSTVEAMTVDALAYSLKKLDGKDKNIAPYRAKAQNLIRSGASGSDAALCALTGLTQTQLDSARAIYASIEGSKDMLSRMMVMGSMMSSKPGTVSKIADRKETPEGHKMMLGMSPEKAIAMAKKMGASDEAISKMEAAMKRKSVVPGASGSSHGGPGHKKRTHRRADRFCARGA